MNTEISFTQQVKEEIANLSFSDEHLRSVLASFIKINGSLSFSNKKEYITVTTENAKVAKFIHSSIDKIYGVKSTFSYKKSKGSNRLVYSILIEESEYILGDLEISFLEGKIAKNIVANDDMIAGYLTGAFLASGSVNSPNNSNYHLEIKVNNDSFAKWFSKLFLKYKGGEFLPKIIKRRDKYVVYLKKSQSIVDFLILMGATESALNFESIRIDRDFSNIGNRLQNLDYANYNKVSLASEQQLEDIKIIQKSIGVDKIENIKQRTLVELRLENNDASFQELASLMSEKLGTTVSRGCVNHLFKAIHTLAEKYK